MNIVSIVSIDLMAMRDNLVDAAIHWATTNKDYMNLRNRYARFLDAMSNGRANRKNDVVGRVCRDGMPKHIVKLAAPSLTVAQQRKLRAVLDKLTILLPELNPRKQRKTEASAQQDTDTNTK